MSVAPETAPQRTLAAGAITLTTGELQRLLKPVLHFASTDETVPVLGVVHLALRGTWLVAETTDRYRMAIQRHRLTKIPKSFEGLLSVRDARHLLALFKVPRGRGLDVVVSLHIADDGTLQVTAVDGLTDFAAASWTYRLFTQTVYPKIPQLMVEALQRVNNKGVKPIALNASFLGDWRHVATDPSLPLRLYAPLPTKPMVLAYGEDFLGLQMPVRPPDGAGQTSLVDVEEWLPVLAAETSTEPDPPAAAAEAAA